MPPSFGSTDRASTPASGTGRKIIATDGELLYLATKRNDSAALEELFARHADMVWHVCQQVLWREADAEDAFQATFLILLRRAGAIRASDSVAAWLYRVAYRTAIAARRRRHKQRTEPLYAEPPEPEVEYPDLESRYITGILLEELSALPQKYQKALVLRYLEGRSRREIADQTDLTIAAVQGYLARGKQLLRGRMLRRGVLLSTGMAMLTTTQAASAAPAALVATNITLGAAVASGAAGALAKVSTTTLQLVDQGARSMFLSTMMAKPVVWVAVAFATAGAVASRQPAEGSGQQAGVVLTAEVDAGEDDGVIQLTAAEAPAKESGDLQFKERPVETPRVEERRIEKPAELSPEAQKNAERWDELEQKIVDQRRQILENKLKSVLAETRRAQLQAQSVREKDVEENNDFDFQRTNAEFYAASVKSAEAQLALLQFDQTVLAEQSKQLNTNPFRALPVESAEASIEMPTDVLIPRGGELPRQPVKVRMMGPTINGVIEVPAPPEPPTPPSFARKAMERSMGVSVPSFVEASKPGMLAPGQTIQVEIYSETAGAEFNKVNKARSEMGGAEILAADLENSSRTFTIEPMGTIAFGAKYGRVKIVGMSIDEAENAIAEKLREQRPDVKVQITLPEPVSAEVIRGRKYEAERAANENAPSVFAPKSVQEEHYRKP